MCIYRGKCYVCISWGNINGGEEGVVIGHRGTQDLLKMDELTKRMSTLMDELNKSKKRGKGEPSSANICDMFDIVICLASEMKSRFELIESQEQEIVQLKEENQSLISNQEKLSSETRHLNDKLDEVEQRGMKGNLLINCTKTDLIKTDDELMAEGTSVQTHVLDLLEKAYDVRIPPSDIQACHRLNKEGRYILRVWNRAAGSAWHTLCNAIKTGKNKQAGIYANFQLTNRRNTMSFHLRQLKKNGKIVKFSTNENGAMSFTTLATDGSEVKHKVTYTSGKENLLVTMTNEEIDDAINGFRKAVKK